MKDTPDQQQFDRGFHAFRDHDYFNAFLQLQPLAERGHTGAQLLMGKMYGLGLGVPQDSEKSEMWTAKAVEKLSGGQTAAESGADRQTIDALTNSVDQALNNLENGQPPTNIPTLSFSVINDLMKKFSNPSVPDHPFLNAPASRPATETDNTQPPSEPEPAVPEQSIAPTGNLKTADELTVQSLRDRANTGDQGAVLLILEAYKKSYYGLHPNPGKIAYWQNRWLALRFGTGRVPSRSWRDKRILFTLLAGLAGLAITFPGSILLWLRSRRKNASAHN